MNATSSGWNSVIDCFVRVLASCEQAVAVDDADRDCRQVFAFGRLDDHIASSIYIFARTFYRLYFAYAGNCVVPSSAIPLSACAKLIIQRKCVRAMPPQSGNAL